MNYFTLIVTNCTIIVLSLRDLVLYHGLSSTLEDLIQVDVVPLTVHFLRPHSQFSRSIIQSSWNYRDQCSIISLWKVLQNIASVLVAVFIGEFSAVIRNITSIPCVESYTLLDYMQTEVNAACCQTLTHLLAGWLVHHTIM